VETPANIVGREKVVLGNNNAAIETGL